MATVTIIADPDQVSIEATDDEASEVPPINLDYDEAIFRVSRQARPDGPHGNNHSTVVYLTATLPDANGTSEPRFASLSDWQSETLNWYYWNYAAGYQLLADGTRNPVYSVVIPAGETYIDIVVQATNDHDYELDEIVELTIVDHFFRYFDGQHTNAEEFFASYEIETELAEITIVDKTANIFTDQFNEDLEDDPGIVIDFNNDDDNLDQYADYFESDIFVDDELVEIKFESLIPEDMNFESDYFTLAFNTSILSLWFNPDKSVGPLDVAQITATTIFEESSAPFSVWVEGVGLGNSEIALVWHENAEFGHRTYVFDSILARVWGIDLDIDSDNNLSIEGNKWEEHLESHTHALGKLIKPGELQLTPAIVRLPKGLDPSENIDYVRFDFQINGRSGVVKLWNYNHSIHLMPNVPYSLTDLGYDAATGTATIQIELFTVSPIHYTKKGVVDFGKPDDRITASWCRGINAQNNLFSDQVKYMFIEDNSFYDNLQNRRELRSSMVAKGVYTSSDMPKFAMRLISPLEMRRELGFSEDLVEEFGNGSPTDWFKAELYQDYVSGNYVASFAGTDELADFLDNVWQGLGYYAPQFETAMRIGDELSRNIKVTQRGLIYAGHSLGGGLASAASMAGGFFADTFNASGLNRYTLIHSETGIEKYPGSLHRFDNAASWINAYHVDWDILSNLQDYIYGMPNAIGNRILLEGPVDDEMAVRLPLGLPLAGIAAAFTAGNPFATVIGLLGPAFPVMVKAHSYYQYGLLVEEYPLSYTRLWDAYGYFDFDEDVE